MTLVASHRTVHGLLHEFSVKTLVNHLVVYLTASAAGVVLLVLLCGVGCGVWAATFISTAAAGLALIIFGLTHVVEERLLVHLEVGITIESVSWLGVKVSSHFHDLAEISDVLINEVLTTTDILYALSFVKPHEGKLAVAFENLRPRLKLLVPIYRAVLPLVRQHTAAS